MIGRKEDADQTMPSVVDEGKMGLHVACERARLGACHLLLSIARARCKRDLISRTGPFNVYLVIQAKEGKPSKVVHVPASTEVGDRPHLCSLYVKPSL